MEIEIETMPASSELRGASPLDGQPLDPVSVTPAESLPSIICEVRVAAEQHAARPVEERVKLLRKLRDAVLARADALASMLMRECGKTEAEAWLVDIVPTADLSAYWCEEGPELLVAEQPKLDGMTYPGKHATVERMPRGVIALIAPWNFPVAIPLRTIFPALLAGNGVVLKPSEHAPRTAAIIDEAAREVLGPHLVRVVQGGADVGHALICAGVDAVVFTGSVATGRRVAHAAADALVPVALELGGKDAAIVLDDANLDRTARGILWAALANAGQNCASVERVYATPRIARPLRERIALLAQQLVAGRDFGALTTPAQLAVVERHVREARDAGAQVLVGGERLDRAGLWYAPTVLAQVPESCALMMEETFGPVVPINEVPDVEAAIAAVNASRYGLTASIWTRDLVLGEKLARRLRVGVITVNNHAFTGAIASLPWTGVRESGYGVTNSAHALDILTRPRTLLVDSSRRKSELWWYPHTPALLRIARAMVTLRRGRAGFFAKLGAAFALLGGLLRRWKV